MFACIILFKLQLKMIQYSRSHKKRELKLIPIHFLSTRLIFSCSTALDIVFELFYKEKQAPQKFSMDTGKERTSARPLQPFYFKTLPLSLRQTHSASFLTCPLRYPMTFSLSSEPDPIHQKNSTSHAAKCASPFCATLSLLCGQPFYSIIISLQQPTNYNCQRNKNKPTLHCFQLSSATCLECPNSQSKEKRRSNFTTMFT